MTVELNCEPGSAGCSAALEEYTPETGWNEVAAVGGPGSAELERPGTFSLRWPGGGEGMEYSD